MRKALLAAVLALAPLAAAAQEVTVVGLDGRTKVFTPQALADLPRAQATIPLGGKDRTYEGPLLVYLLREVGAPAGARLHAEAMRNYVAAIGDDGFLAVYALAEVDKDFHEGTVILADTVDGQKLDEKEGPYRTVVAGDRKASRSVYRTIRIELRRAD
ncbi:MAG: molybdopterin-dependent oxidoreductase [Phenylobacterium sp.]|uniref:molybdopterin-dependent oxidoreductase n=1 Tax=Phenylobacterium sp. TaxID=1871053 RepID=UPI00391D47AE